MFVCVFVFVFVSVFVMVIVLLCRFVGFFVCSCFLTISVYSRLPSFPYLLLLSKCFMFLCVVVLLSFRFMSCVLFPLRQPILRITAQVNLDTRSEGVWGWKGKGKTQRVKRREEANWSLSRFQMLLGNQAARLQERTNDTNRLPGWTNPQTLSLRRLNRIGRALLSSHCFF